MTKFQIKSQTAFGMHKWSFENICRAFENNQITYSNSFLQYIACYSLRFWKKVNYNIFTSQRISSIFDKYHLEILFWQNCCVITQSTNHLSAIIAKFSSIHDAIIAQYFHNLPTEDLYIIPIVSLLYCSWEFDKTAASWQTLPWKIRVIFEALRQRPLSNAIS